MPVNIRSFNVTEDSVGCIADLIGRHFYCNARNVASLTPANTKFPSICL